MALRQNWKFARPNFRGCRIRRIFRIAFRRGRSSSSAGNRDGDHRIICKRAFFQFDLSRHSVWSCNDGAWCIQRSGGSWFPQRNCILGALVVIAWWRVANILPLCSSSRYFCRVSWTHNIDHRSDIENGPQPQCSCKQIIGHKLGSINWGQFGVPMIPGSEYAIDGFIEINASRIFSSALF